MNMSNSNSITTQDMGLAVALLCRGHNLQNLIPSGNGYRITFEFDLSSTIEDDERHYWDGTLLVEAKQFWNETKNLKTRLYSLR
jgi:hypothetical protein